MTTALLSIVTGVALLVWSADRFVEGAASVARHLGVSPLLIGMVIVGFGTSAPELVVSATTAVQGKPGIALGNAYGSNITNIGLILGLTALMSPITVHSRVLRRELPILTLVTALAVWQLWDREISRLDAVVLLVVFAVLMVWTIRQGVSHQGDALGDEIEGELELRVMTLRQALVWVVVGLVLLVASSRILVWGVVQIAHRFGVSDLIIGLTIVATGTSLPELASSIAAARTGEHDIALGNVLGSNLFNTLTVVGIAGSIHPMSVAGEILTRDMLVMSFLTLSLFIFGYGFRGPGRINRVEGALLLVCYIGYTAYLAMVVHSTHHG